MGKREAWRDRIRAELGTAKGRARLVPLLLEASNLPGPRGNLELAAGFADACSEAAGPELIAWLEKLAATPPREAPGDQPEVMAPFCAVLALGALGPDAGRSEAVETALAGAADDPRWRMREAAAMGLQRLGYRDAAWLRRLLEGWLAEATPLRLRAVLAALADPPLLADEGLARLGLEATEVALGVVGQLPAAARRSDEVAALIKGLSYAPSLFVEKLPLPGFALLRRWARRGDAVINRAIASNLDKARLTKRYPREIEALRTVVEAGPARRRRQAP